MVLVKDYRNKNENWQKRKITENISQKTHKVTLDEGSEWIRHTDQIWPHNQINNSLSPVTNIINLPNNDSTKSDSEPTHNIASIDT
jgi:broad-specificity NMP kinase